MQCLRKFQLLCINGMFFNCFARNKLTVVKRNISILCRRNGILGVALRAELYFRTCHLSMPTTVLLEVRSQKRKFSTNNDNDGISGNESAKKDSGITFTDVDIEIIKRHTNACKLKKNTYTDPKTGYSVFTEYYHLVRGCCCGNQCRHCPFNHENVPEDRRCKKFNSLFYH